MAAVTILSLQHFYIVGNKLFVCVCKAHFGNSLEGEKSVLLSVADMFVLISNHLNSKAYCTLPILFLWLPWEIKMHIITHKSTT